MAGTGVVSTDTKISGDLSDDWDIKRTSSALAPKFLALASCKYALSSSSLDRFVVQLTCRWDDHQCGPGEVFFKQP